MRKIDCINAILTNSLYQPESAMRKKLAKGLEKLSLYDIRALKLIVEIKENDALKKAAKISASFAKLL